MNTLGCYMPYAQCHRFVKMDLSGVQRCACRTWQVKDCLFLSFGTTIFKRTMNFLDESVVTSVLRIKRIDMHVEQYLHFSFLNSTHKVIIVLFCKLQNLTQLKC